MELRFRPKMRLSLKIFQSNVAWLIAIVCLGLPPRFQARPIEFSAPTDPAVSSTLNSVGPAPKELPQAADYAIKPPELNQRLPNAMKPLPPPPSSNRNPPAEPKKHWSLTTPEEMMKSMIERDILKLPPSGADQNEWTRPARKGLATNRWNSFDSQHRSGETNFFNAPGLARGQDRFGSFGGQRTGGWNTDSYLTGRPSGFSDLFHQGEETSPEAMRERKAQLEQLEKFKKSFTTTMPGWAPARNSSSSSPGGFGAAPQVQPENSPGSLAKTPGPVFTLPSAPVAPSAPAGPGQSSLTPAPYTPAPKIKPSFSAPRRKF